MSSTKWALNENPVASGKMNKLAIPHYTTADRTALTSTDVEVGSIIYDKTEDNYYKVTAVTPSVTFKKLGPTLGGGITLIDLLNAYKGRVDIDGGNVNGLQLSGLGPATIQETPLQMYVDWADIIGSTFKIEIIWGHDPTNAPDATGHKAILRNFDDAVDLASQVDTSTLNKSAVSLANRYYAAFTKPTGIKRVGIQLRNGDTLARNFYIWAARIWVLP